ncbi:efflux RND transporter permease subunit [Kineosporia sp. NBRC 101731]|uniref:MMPL family transporter n=1 Tax=Kineosporia sp. NBRC 101731 TaxID=3032199 RepID=UPI0024A20DA0|nr:efflux RND transporter permease subunit [Kineosporia sp. NBRC 101731]GLY32693.1 membrane protein [Kineosporia sp. NBRC 101731]
MVRLANWCTRRWYLVIGGWLVALIALAGLVVANGTAFTDATELPDSESATAYSLLGSSASADAETGRIVWQTADGTSVTGRATRAEITTLIDDLKNTEGVLQVVSPYTKAGASQINREANTAFATVTVAADADIEPMVDVVDSARSGGLAIEAGGQAFTEQPGASGGTEAIGLIVALVLLLLFFRSFAAAVLPIVTGVAGVGVCLLGVMAVSHVVDLSANSLTMGALIGLGVGIDYALFIVNRHRKALLAGTDVPGAIAQALNTSGRAVVFAGLTVIAALVGMYVIGVGILTGMAFAAAFTVLATVIAANTLLPALLRVLRLKVLSRRQRAEARADTRPPSDQPKLAARWADGVQRHPVLAALASLVVVAALAVPALSLRLGNADASSDPAGSASRAYFELMSEGFGEGADATLLLVGKTPDASSVTAFADMVETLPTVPHVASAVLTSQAGGVSVAALTPTDSAQTQETSDLVHTLRDSVIPDSGVSVYVGGTTATNIDLSDAIMDKLPLYLVLVALLGFLLLVLAFRSLLVPFLGAVTNLATICVGLGVITAVFQFGWGSELLGVGEGAPILYLVPVLIAGVIFGLSMDYQVFLVSSMHEHFHRSGDNRSAVREGLAESAGVIVAAATIMLAVFASFAFSGQRIVSAIGLGMAISVVVDAFVIRLTLMPALMTLIGRATWYYPKPLDAITPRLALENAEPPAPASEPEPVYSYSGNSGTTTGTR